MMTAEIHNDFSCQWNGFPILHATPLSSAELGRCLLLRLIHSVYFYRWHLYNSAAACAKSHLCLVKAVDLRVCLPLSRRVRKSLWKEGTPLWCLPELLSSLHPHLHLQERCALSHPSFKELGAGDSATFTLFWDVVLLITLKHLLEITWGFQFLFKA